LPHGHLHEAIALDADPVARAQGWEAKGADYLLVVDLNAAAYGDYSNRPLVDRIVSQVGIPVLVAGGVRSAQEVERRLTAGAWRIAMGTTAIEDQVATWEICRGFPGQVIITLDVKPDEELVVRGWTAHSGRHLEEVIIELSSAGVAGFMIAEANRDALAEPPNFLILREAMSYVDDPVIAAGGVRNLSDLRALTTLESDGKRLEGVVVGREVTEGRFTMEEAAALLVG
ncbi:MAG: HisA/HisF-related TIM barrel protein, partial [Acidimicrobiia bacterium]|nr:HisA/HisF-related TIM barrel protein [Acidimicrobiia bacterium]